MENKTKQISFRVSQEEYSKILNFAGASNLTPSEYVRRVVCEQVPVVVDRSRDFLQGVVKISNFANGPLNEESANNIRTECVKLWQLLKS